MISRNQNKLLKKMHKHKMDMYTVHDQQTIDDIEGLILLKYATYVPCDDDSNHYISDPERYVFITSLGIAAKEARREKLFMFYLPLAVNFFLSLAAIIVSICTLKH